MRATAACFLLFPATISVTAFAEPPSLLLASNYHAEVDLSRYRMSEKYDGIRALWTGEQLVTRSGHRIAAPEWFTANWPATPLDGELWIGRGKFEQVSSVVRDAIPDGDAWQQVKFMVFDLPSHSGPFAERLAMLAALLSNAQSTHLQRVEQIAVATQAELFARLDQLVSGGAEGLMLHRMDSYYHAQRNDDLLKLKPHQDEEARVVGYLPGKGKYEGMMGALHLMRADGLEFHLGTGFTDEQRRHPPQIGEWVTYTFHGVTARGVPRFARFLRVRHET